MATQPRGFGRQNFGPGRFGAGGPLVVVRAIAVAGQTVRVVFNEEPTHQSAAGPADALNPANYVFTVPAGNATNPVPVGVDVDMVVGPTYGVGNGGNTGERAFDVSVDRQLIVGITYLVTVQNVAALLGGNLGSPVAASFPGVTRLLETKLPARTQDLVDFANPPAVGHWIVDDSGDITVETPDDGTKKRVYRRGFTKKNSFVTLGGYGAAIDHKGVASPARLATFKSDYQNQAQQEPDVAAASVQVTQQQSGITLVQVQARTIRGTFVDSGGKISALGAAAPM